MWITKLNNYNADIGIHGSLMKRAYGQQIFKHFIFKGFELGKKKKKIVPSMNLDYSIPIID